MTIILSVQGPSPPKARQGCLPASCICLIISRRGRPFLLPALDLGWLEFRWVVWTVPGRVHGWRF